MGRYRRHFNFLVLILVSLGFGSFIFWAVFIDQPAIRIHRNYGRLTAREILEKKIGAPVGMEALDPISMSEQRDYWVDIEGNFDAEGYGKEHDDELAWRWHDLEGHTHGLITTNNPRSKKHYLRYVVR